MSKILSDTDVAHLQPDYLEKQLKEATDEVTEAEKEIIKFRMMLKKYVYNNTGILKRKIGKPSLNLSIKRL